VREQVAEGVRIVLAHDGPWNLGTLIRRVRAALGAGAYRQLARGTKMPVAGMVTGRGPWRAYLASPRRATIELALDRLADVDLEAPSGAETSLRILNGYLLWLEHARPGAARKRVAQTVATLVDALGSRSESAISFDPAEPIAPEIDALRRELSESSSVFAASPSGGRALRMARAEIARLLRQWVDRELRQLLEEHDAELRDIEFDLDVALAATLAAEARPWLGARVQP
jgi:hypothetical protein